ncbi:disease resistance TIR-NBS-LRR class family protein, partial [Tanacetum coccineum]
LHQELSGKVVRYAVGLPLTIKVLGSFLCGKDMDEWEDAIERLKDIPSKETLEKLELSYMSLEDDYKEIFLDIACLLKGKTKEDAIKILECCGFHARNGFKVLEQRSLITISTYGCFDMHDHIKEMGKNIVHHVHIEEMGKNIVHREHRDEPNKHSRLWISEEIKNILTNDLGTEETRRLKLNKSRVNAIIVMKGLGKMKKLRYLEVDGESDGKCWKLNILKNLKFLSLCQSKLTTFDFRITPNLETLSLELSTALAQLFMLASCEKLNYVSVACPNLKILNLYNLRLRSLNLELFPNLESLHLNQCFDFVELQVSGSRLRSLDLELFPNLERLHLKWCDDFVELQVSAPITILKSLNLYESGLRSLDLDLIPNLKSLDLQDCRKLVEINAPVGCLKRVDDLNLRGCLRFTSFEFCRPKTKINCSSDSLDLEVGNIEKLISFSLCACTDLKKFSDIICSLQCLQKLTLKCNIPEFPKDLGQLECLEELCLSSTKIKHLPDSICMLKRLKSLEVNNGDLLEKLSWPVRLFREVICE